MPRRADPGDREALEAALGPQNRAALSRFCSTLGVPRDRWQEVPFLQQLFSTVAVIRLAGQLQELEDNGVSSSRGAIERAGRRLDVAPDTVRTRIRRLDSL